MVKHIARSRSLCISPSLEKDETEDVIRICGGAGYLRAGRRAPLYSPAARNDRAETLFFKWQSEGLCLTTEPQAVPELKAIDRIEQRIFAAVQPGEEIKYQPGFGNRNLFYECKSRLQRRANSRGPMGITTGLFQRKE